MKKCILSLWLFLALPLLADPYLELAKELVPEGSPPIRMAFSELLGRGAGSDKWQSSLDLARTKLEEAFKSLQSVTLIDRTNLKALEEENALRGKSTRITEVDTIATGFIMIVEKKLVMSLSLLNTASQKKNTATQELDPGSLGIDIEKDDPPADAAVRLCDSTMFDIVDNLAKIEVNQNEIKNVKIRNDADKKYVDILNSKAKEFEIEINDWAATVIEELTKLSKLDNDIVKKSLTDRGDYLFLRERIEKTDYSRQQKLNLKVVEIYEKNVQDGLKPNVQTVLNACEEVYDSEPKTDQDSGL